MELRSLPVDFLTRVTRKEGWQHGNLLYFILFPAERKLFQWLQFFPTVSLSHKTDDSLNKRINFDRHLTLANQARESLAYKKSSATEILSSAAKFSLESIGDPEHERNVLCLDF